MKTFLGAGIGVLLVLGCAPQTSPKAPAEFQRHLLTDVQTESAKRVAQANDGDFDLNPILDLAEETATPEGKRILQTGRAMIEADIVVVGSCWDYIDAVYKRAGFTPHNEFVSFASKKSGPYADLKTLQAGDWLYIVNHSFGDVEHSGIFVAWTDEIAGEALLLSYAGGESHNPARYKVYDLSSVYNVIKPKAERDSIPPPEIP